MGRDQFVNIGSGDFDHPRWTNLDHSSAWYAHAHKNAFVEHDLMALGPLPFGDESLILAYTSHTIEHVTDAAVAVLFREVHRVLKRGGLFRITCPDADLLYWATRFGRRDYWQWRHGWFARNGANPDTLPIEEFLIRELATERSRFTPDVPGCSKVDAQEARTQLAGSEKKAFLDWLTRPCRFRPDYPGNHINWWSREKCEAFLSEAGFSTILNSTRGGSMAAPLQDLDNFDSTAPEMSVYIEAIKS